MLSESEPFYTALLLNPYYQIQGFTWGGQVFLCWTPVGHPQFSALLNNFFPHIKPFLARSIIFQLPQGRFPWPLCQDGALRISLVLPFVLMLFYLGCSFLSCFCISFISVQITGKTCKRSLNSSPSLGKQIWLSLWRVAYLGPFGPTLIQSLWSVIKAWNFLVISFFMVDEAFDSVSMI